MSYDWDASDDPRAPDFKAAEEAAREAFYDVVTRRFGVTREEYQAIWDEASAASEAAYLARAPR